MHSPTPLPDQKDENRIKAAIALEHVNALAANPHFAWFMEHVLAKARDDEQAKALNVTLSAEAREQACWRHDLARTLCGKLDDLRRLYSPAATVSGKS